MQTYTLPRQGVRPVFDREWKHPLLRAFNNIRCGSIVVTLPDGRRKEFRGQDAGPAAQMIIHDMYALDEGIAQGEIGFAEGYIHQRWDSPDLPAMLTFALMNTQTLERFFHGRPWHALWLKAKYRLQGNSLSGSRRNVAAHYDLGNDFYALWLDKSMTYSCALFEGDRSRSLEEAQAAKYRRILNKLQAKPGQDVLEIGCGWGGFAEAAAQDGLQVTAVTLSKEQAIFATERLWRAGLSHLVDVRLTDYREVDGEFDHIVSIGMFEHVGEKYWTSYFETIHDRLVPGGTALVQTITLDDDLFEELRGVTGFIEHYIFPGGMLPSRRRFREAAEKAGLQCREMYAFGKDYAETLRRWLASFEAHTSEVLAQGKDEAFIRLWRFYLASCIASFESGRSSVMQAELSRAA